MIKMYLNSHKESNRELAGELGLIGEAAENFCYALYEVEFDCELNTETGNVVIKNVRDVK